MDTHLKEELTDLFSKLSVSLSHRQSRKRLVDTGVMVNNTSSTSMVFTHIYLMQGKKLESLFVSPAIKEYFGFEPAKFLSTN